MLLSKATQEATWALEMFWVGKRKANPCASPWGHSLPGRLKLPTTAVWEQGPYSPLWHWRPAAKVRAAALRAAASRKYEGWYVSNSKRHSGLALPQLLFFTPPSVLVLSFLLDSRVLQSWFWQLLPAHWLLLWRNGAQEFLTPPFSVTPPHNFYWVLFSLLLLS